VVDDCAILAYMGSKGKDTTGPDVVRKVGSIHVGIEVFIHVALLYVLV